MKEFIKSTRADRVRHNCEGVLFQVTQNMNKLTVTKVK